MALYQNKDGKRRTLADSFGDAARGIIFAVKTERNMRIHLTAAVYVMFLAPFLGVSRGEYALLLLTIAMVIAAEGFNTAIEMLCDYAQKSYNPFIGRTKDIAAGAVLICALFAVVIGAVVLFRPTELWLLLCAIATHPGRLIAFAVSVILAFIFVFVGPVAIADRLEKIRKREK